MAPDSMAKPPSYNRYVEDCLCCGRELTDQDRNTFREISLGFHVGARSVCLECQEADQRSTIGRINLLLRDQTAVPMDPIVINDWIRVRWALNKLTGASFVSDQVAMLQILKKITDHVLIAGERFTPYQTHILPLRDVEMFLTDLLEGFDLRTKQNYSTPDLYDRDKWLYEQRKLGRTIPDIQRELNEKRNEWPQLLAENSVRTAIKRYCLHYNHEIPEGKIGRPKTPQ